MFLFFVNDLTHVVEALLHWWPGGHRAWSFTDLPNATISQSGEKFPWECLFFPDGSGTPIPISTLVKDLGVQTDNMFWPTAQCTEAANKARWLIFMIRHSFQIGFHPCIRRLRASAPQIWFASLFAKPRCRYQPSWANSKIIYKVGNWHASLTAAAGPSFVAAAGDFKILKGLLDIDPNLFFQPPAQRGQ